MITIKKLAEHLENMIKDGKGDLPVYVVDHEGKGALPLQKGDTLRMAGQRALLLVPEAKFNIAETPITN